MGPVPQDDPPSFATHAAALLRRLPAASRRLGRHTLAMLAIVRSGWIGGLTALGTLGLVIIGLIQAAIIYKQLAATEIEQRPWVSVTLLRPDKVIPQPVRIDKDSNGPTVTIRLKLENVGHLPALAVFVAGKVYPTIPHTPTEGRAMQREICGDAGTFGDTIFPGQSVGEDLLRTFIIDKDEIRKFHEKYKGNDGYLSPYVVLCAAYRDPAGTLHHTPYSFHISLVDPRQNIPLAVDMNDLPPKDKRVQATRAMEYSMNPD